MLGLLTLVLGLSTCAVPGFVCFSWTTWEMQPKDRRSSFRVQFVKDVNGFFHKFGKTSRNTCLPQTAQVSASVG